MRILNKTDWCGKDLQSIFRQCLKSRGYESRAKGMDLIVEVVDARGGDVTGWAYLGRVYMKKRLPKRYGGGFRYFIKMRIPTMKRWIFVVEHGSKTFKDCTASVARVFLHETDHAFAELRHAQMPSSNTLDVSFLNGTVLGALQKRPL